MTFSCWASFLGGNTAGSASPSISGVIVRSVVDERTSSSAGPVSKGAVKEFPPSVTRAVLTPSPAPSLSGQSLIGIKRTLNDSALTTAVDRRVSYSTFTGHPAAEVDTTPKVGTFSVTKIISA